MKLIDQSPEFITRRLKAIEDKIADLQSERRGRSMTVSGGDLVVDSGGNVRVNDQGSIIVGLLGRIVKIGATRWTHLADGWLWVETLVNPANPLLGGTYPKAVYQENGLLIAYAAGIQVNVGIQPDGTMLLQSTANKIALQHLTTSASANVVMDAFGTVTRSTSSRRYKRDIEDLNVEPAAVLKMRPRTWRDRLEVDGDPDTKHRYVGFIAEEVHDAGLTEFVVYDDEGRPDAIAYDRLTVALLAVLKDQQARLDRIEATIATDKES